MITGLNAIGDAVIVGDNTIICLGNNEYKVNGENVKINGYGVKQYTVPNNSEILVKVVSPRKIDYIIDSSGEKISGQEFYSHRRAITEPFEDEDGDLFFSDIDIEYKVKKQFQEMDSWEKVYTEETVKWTPLEVNILGKSVDTGSPYIECAISLGQTSFQNGIFSVNLSRAAKEAFFEAAKGYPNDCSSHSNIEYAKVLGAYIFTKDNNRWVTSDTVKKVFSSLDDAKTELDKVQNYVTRKVKLKIAEQKGKVLDNGQLVTILSQVRKIRSELSSVVPVKRTEGSYRQSTKLLNGMIESLEEILLED